MAINISVRKNGPLMVTGDLSQLGLADNDGNPIECAPVDMNGQPMVFLCRCGASTKKPFCDGAHLKAGFKDG